jgi:hypothetical protein
MNFFITTLLGLNVSIGSLALGAGAPKCHDVFYTQPQPSMAQAPKPRGLPKGYDIKEFPENTAARVYIELAVRNMLIQQLSPELDARGLIKPNGGLCATTCVANILGSITAQYENFRSFPKNVPAIIELVVDSYGKVVGQDARFGANVNQISQIIHYLFPEVLKFFKYSSMLEELVLSTTHLNQRSQTFYIEKALREDAIAIVTVKHVDSKTKKISFHAIVVLKVDRNQNKIYYSDPNYPNQIIVAPYKYNPMTGIEFNLPYTYGDQPVSIYESDIFTRKIFKIN